MKNTALIILLFSCFISGCGTLGSFGVIGFPISKEKLGIGIDSLYAVYPKYKIPQKWNAFNDWSKRGYGFLEDRIFYLKSTPEEMYYVSISQDTTGLKPNPNISIAIRAVCKGTDYWYLNEDINSNERERIEKRFEDEIISKIEKYTNSSIILEQNAFETSYWHRPEACASIRK